MAPPSVAPRRAPLHLGACGVRRTRGESYVRTKLLLMTSPDDQDPPVVVDIDIPHVPERADNFTHNGRGYLILQRSFVTEPRQLEGSQEWGMHAALLVRQVAGPDHVLPPGPTVPASARG